MAQTLVFLFYNPLSPEDPEKYGLKAMESMGARCQFWVLLPLMSQHRPLEPGPEWVLDWADLDHRFAALEPEALFVDFFGGLSAWVGPMERVYRRMKAFGFRYVIPNLAPLPIAVPLVSSGLERGRFSRRLAKLKGLNKKRFKDLWTSRLVLLLKRATQIYPKPVQVFSLDNETLDQYCYRNQFPKELVVPIHSMDYDRFLAYRNSTPKAHPQKVCVFLDQAFTHHPDLKQILGQDPAKGAEAYLKKMNRLFGEIESKTGLKVVIAAHPRSQYDKLGNPFEERELVKGSTLEWVDRSQMVVAHWSTSVGLAALFGKPLLIAWVAGSHPLTRTLAHKLNTSLIDLERPEELDHFNLEQFPFRATDYTSYIRHYLKSEQAPAEQSCWQIMGPQLLKL
ncbi:MAG: hypothetical protein A2600_12330 [Candidatus Lambdaproteobacteria bacterium RIFOXYD1_FULL_56_27]|uniref:UDP-N-acetylglucosamine 2-epimerase domain-containing protein n=1 Tax=Candidatus Lambdaproteobacteria bacterium RIFOXYD2_FULL_56_26 TaxID=1817773 RepID=A0A1F6GLH4_9PROT|nr:MAG: hypothetical protein A2557_02135 [Candidatus Lambdaproteobacteria bacterium RIFOXYD2_FULL_56_26]OGH02723.1 MAG: hypothetical protein A2426_07340 [Candidatus Lambdaproteobacteria bacterium RIFOXYC1_FULL_56_13]OGH08636.1 MAG: hypothetical protein A2600_12330 [Candidatus Lambdaproteobacteria bacterium RIFOXYD1_FULL_56_27]